MTRTSAEVFDGLRVAPAHRTLRSTVGLQPQLPRAEKQEISRAAAKRRGVLRRSRTPTVISSSSDWRMRATPVTVVLVPSRTQRKAVTRRNSDKSETPRRGYHDSSSIRLREPEQSDHIFKWRSAIGGRPVRQYHTIMISWSAGVCLSPVTANRPSRPVLVIGEIMQVKRSARRRTARGRRGGRSASLRTGQPSPSTAICRTSASRSQAEGGRPRG